MNKITIVTHYGVGTVIDRLNREFAKQKSYPETIQGEVRDNEFIIKCPRNFHNRNFLKANAYGNVSPYDYASLLEVEIKSGSLMILWFCSMVAGITLGINYSWALCWVVMILGTINYYIVARQFKTHIKEFLQSVLP